MWFLGAKDAKNAKTEKKREESDKTQLTKAREAKIWYNLCMRILSKVEWNEAVDGKCDVSFISPMERRRLTALEKAAISVAWKAQEAVGGAPDVVVFASRWGEIGTTLKLMRQMFEEGEMSPAGFSNSVHNAAPGHFSLLTKNHAPYTAIAAAETTYEMGLLEASTYPGRVLFVYAEEATPELYRPHFADIQQAHAVAMVVEN